MSSLLGGYLYTHAMQLKREATENLIEACVGPRRVNRWADVATVQRLVNLTGEQVLRVDGIFGPRTQRAVADFQHTAGLAPSGVVEVESRTLVRLAEVLTLQPGNTIAVLFLRADESELARRVPWTLAAMARYRVDTWLRQAHYLGQVGHETAEFRYREEIASGDAYDTRADLGNTPERDGDGRRWKGRGDGMLTGADNYRRYAQYQHNPAILDHPEVVAQDDYLCADTFGWYWDTHQINAHADLDDIIAVTRAINGGTNGLASRRHLTDRAKIVLRVAEVLQS